LAPRAGVVLATSKRDVSTNAAARLEAGWNARRCVEGEFHPATLAENYLTAMRRAVETECGPTETIAEYAAVSDEETMLELEHEKR